MRKLHLVGLTTERDGLIFTARKGSKSGGFIVPIDAKVLAAIDEASGRVNGGPLDDDPILPEIEAVPKRLRSESALTPREMQARLRAGRSIDEVAAEAGVDTEWVARFAVPILAEQAQVVELARALTYAKPRLGESSQPLGTSVLQSLSDRGVFLPDDVAHAGWSAFQLHDSVWMVRFRYRSRGREQEAQWEIDVPTGRLRARNRQASDLGYVDPERWRNAGEQDEPSTGDDAAVEAPPRAQRKAAGPARRPSSSATRTAKKSAKATRARATKAAPKAATAARRPPARAASPTATTPKTPAKAAKSAKSAKSDKTAKGAKSDKTAKGAKAAPPAVRARGATVATPSRSTNGPRTPVGSKSTTAGAEGTATKASATAKAPRRRPAKAAPASEAGPGAGSGGVRMAVARVSTARVAASMATADREPWAAAVQRPSRSDGRASAPAGPGARGVDGQLRPASPRPRRKGDTDQMPAFEPRPLPPPGQEPAKPRVRKVTVPRPPSPAEGPPAVSLPAPRRPVPAQEPMPAERPKRRRLRSR